MQGSEQFAAFLDRGLSEIVTAIDEAEYRLLCDEVPISCTHGMLLWVPRRSALRTCSPT